MCGMLTYDFDRFVLNERGFKIMYLNETEREREKKR